MVRGNLHCVQNDDVVEETFYYVQNDDVVEGILPRLQNDALVMGGALYFKVERVGWMWTVMPSCSAWKAMMRLRVS